MLRRSFTVAIVVAILATLAVVGLRSADRSGLTPTSAMLTAASVLAASGTRHALSEPVELMSSPRIVIASGDVAIAGEREDSAKLGPDTFERAARGEYPLALDEARIEIDLTRTAAGAGATDGEADETGATVAPLVAALTAAGLDTVSVSSSTLVVKTGTGPSLELSDVAAEVRRSSGRLTIQGTADYLGRSVTIELDIGQPSAPGDGVRTIPVKGVLANALFSTAFNGAILTGAQARIASKDAELRIVDVAKLLTWTGTAWPAHRSVRSFNVDGHMEWTGRALTFSHAKFIIDGNVATGSLSVTDRDQQTFIDGTLAFDRLDTTAYLTSADDDAAAGNTAAQSGKAEDDRQGEGSRSGEGEGANKADPGADTAASETANAETAVAAPVLDWIDALATSAIHRLSRGPLRQVNADLRLSASRFQARDFTATGLAATLNLNSGHLLVDVADMQLENGGRGTVQIAIDGQAATPNCRLLAKLEGLSLSVASKMVLGTALITGNGNLRASLKGQGLTREDLMSTMAGRIDITGTGRVSLGFDLKALTARADGSSGQEAAPSAPPTMALDGWARALTGRTDLDGFAAKLRVGEGQVLVESAAGTSGDKLVAGYGHADIPQNEIDFVIDVGEPDAKTRADAKDGSGGDVPSNSGRAAVLGGEASSQLMPMTGDRVRISGKWQRPNVAVEPIPPQKDAALSQGRFRTAQKSPLEFGGPSASGDFVWRLSAGLFTTNAVISPPM